MNFVLPFQIKPSANKISYQDKLFFIGSCFTEEISHKLSNLKFRVIQNPNGILYDPQSISDALNSYIENKCYDKDDLFLLNDLWHSWKHHSVFSGIDKDEVLQNINQSQSSAHQFLKDANWLIITLGSSFHYILKEKNIAVSNCHKAPASMFDKELIASEKIISQLSGCISKLQSCNPNIKIIVTVSPVRHSRYGLHENNRSKARLIDAAHTLSETFQHVFYFPAYELVIDVLRDYRFYKNDLVHPSEAATEYVFEAFCNTYLDEGDQKLLTEVKAIISSMNHRPFQIKSDNYKNFKKTQLEKLAILKGKFPYLNFSKEEIFFQSDD